MTGFEEGFADTERAATLTAKSAGEVAKVAKVLEKAAKVGSVNAMRRAQSDLTAALNTLRQEVANATETWPFEPSAEQTYLRESFAAELRHVAAPLGLEIHERDEQLIAHPSIVRILPSNLAVRIDKKQTSTIRPSYLASLLVKNQKKPARFNSKDVLESLYSAYATLVGEQSNLRLNSSNHGPTVPLTRIYEAFTIQPGSKREYSRTDFARDLYRLQTGGPQETSRGRKVHFHGGRQSPIAFVGADGHIITYHSIEFSGGA